jgi:hypothetical protein
MAVPLLAQAATNTLTLTDVEPQYESKLCWAASDLLAVNHFYPKCPSSTGTSTATLPLFPTSQALDAAYNTSAKSGAASVGWYFTNVCAPQLGNCNDWGDPPLNGLTYKWNTGTNGLDWGTMKQQIDAGRPVLFRWKYPPDGVSPTSPVDDHEMVVTGYSDDSGTQQLQIFDPWPVPDVLPPQIQPACGPDTGVQFTENHRRWIDFTVYSNPKSDMGVAAEHDKDQWDLKPVAPDAPVLTVESVAPTTAPLPPFHTPQPPVVAPPPFHTPPPPSVTAPQLSFARALSTALPHSRQLNLQTPGTPPRSLGVPFPIVGLGFVQLLHAANDPTSLLAGTTSAILFPVESQGEVVDAFLLLFTREHWERGGYANIEITRRLVKVRATYAAKQNLPLDNFYMVSVPGEVAFFAAYGKGKQAILIPASTDPSIEAFAGQPVPAEKQLKELILSIQRDLLRHPDRTRIPVRPG